MLLRFEELWMRSDTTLRRDLGHEGQELGEG